MSEIEVGLGTLSASRIGTMNKCGLAFKYQYVNKLPAPYDTGARMFGIAIHDGVDNWYLEQDYKTYALRDCVRERWKDLLPPSIWSGVHDMISLREGCDKVVEEIKATRDVKSPESTKAFLTSDENQAFKEAKNELLLLCDKSSEVRWAKDEDPFKAYSKSLDMADMLQERWRPQPQPLAVEQSFMIDIGDFQVRGRIDQLRQDINLETGELLDPVLLDIKTGRQLFSQMDAFVQAFCYWQALALNPDLPDTNTFVFFNTRTGKEQRGTIDPDRHAALAYRILNGVGRRIAMAQFEPSYGFWCKMCDFNDICASEINLWEGDGVVT